MPGAIPYNTPEASFILVSIPVSILMAYIPWVISLFGHLKAKSAYDNANPRLYLASMENDALSGNPRALFTLRCYACHLNGLEDVACWVAAPLVSLLFSGVRYIALCVAAIYIGLRCIYICLYCFGSNKAMSYARTFIYWCIWCCPLILLFEAVSEIAY